MLVTPFDPSSDAGPGRHSCRTCSHPAPMRRSYTRGEEGRMPRDEIHVSTTTHIDIHGTCSGCGSAYARTEDHESERQFVELLLLCDGCLDEWNSIPRHLGMAADT